MGLGGTLTGTMTTPRGNGSPPPALRVGRGADGQLPLGRTPESQPETRYDPWIYQLSEEYGVDPNLVKAIIRVESNFDPNAKSGKGALGLMQLLPGTGKEFGVENFFDPEENIRGGVRYLKWLEGQFDSRDDVIAAYNAGPTAVREHGGVPPGWGETEQYLQRVNSFLPPLPAPQDVQVRGELGRVPSSPLQNLSALTTPPSLPVGAGSPRWAGSTFWPPAGGAVGPTPPAGGAGPPLGGGPGISSLAGDIAQLPLGVGSPRWAGSTFWPPAGGAGGGGIPPLLGPSTVHPAQFSTAPNLGPLTTPPFPTDNIAAGLSSVPPSQMGDILGSFPGPLPQLAAAGGIPPEILMAAAGGAAPGAIPGAVPGAAGAAVPDAAGAAAKPEQGFIASLFSNPQFMQGLFRLAASLGGGRYAGAAGQGVSQAFEQQRIREAELRQIESQRVLEGQREAELAIQQRRAENEKANLQAQAEERKVNRTRFRQTAITNAVATAAALRDPRIAAPKLNNSLKRLNATAEEIEFANSELEAALGQYQRIDLETGEPALPLQPGQMGPPRSPGRTGYQTSAETIRRQETILEREEREKSRSRSQKDSERIERAGAAEEAHRFAWDERPYDSLPDRVKELVTPTEFDVLKHTRPSWAGPRPLSQQVSDLILASKARDPETNKLTPEAQHAADVLGWMDKTKEPALAAARSALLTSYQRTHYAMFDQDQIEEILENPALRERNLEMLAKSIGMNRVPRTDPDNPLQVLDPVLMDNYQAIDPRAEEDAKTMAELAAQFEEIQQQERLEAEAETKRREEQELEEHNLKARGRMR